MRLLMLLSVVWMLTACASGTRPTPGPLPDSPAEAWALVRCPAELPPATDGSSITLLQNHKTVTVIYRECRQRHNELADREETRVREQFPP